MAKINLASPVAISEEWVVGTQFTEAILLRMTYFTNNLPDEIFFFMGHALTWLAVISLHT